MNGYAQLTDNASVSMLPATVRLSRLLVPLDFSASSLRAFHYAFALAECFGGELALLHVVPPPVLPEWGYAHLARRDERLKLAARQRLEEFVRAHSSVSARVRQLLVRAGEPNLQIPEAARQQNSDLVVIATHGETVVPHCLLGNTAEEVVRRAPCPVWVVPGATGDNADSPVLLPMRRILVATDFSADSLKAIRYGVALAREFDATLHLVHVVPTVLPADVSHLTTLLQASELRDSARREIARLRAKSLPPGLRVVTTVLEGNPFIELGKEAERICAGLIVVSTHGHTGLRYLFLGCAAQRVVQHTSVPVLVVRDQEVELVPPAARYAAG